MKLMNLETFVFFFLINLKLKIHKNHQTNGGDIIG